MASRFRFLWNRLSVLTRSFRQIPNKSNNRNITNRFSKPYLLGFSIFTWLGFDKKLNAEDELIHTIKHCILFIEKNECDKAEQLLHVALRQAQQIRHQLGITYIYDVMANLALQREELDKAKQLFVAVTQRIMADGVPEDDLRVVHLSVKLARISHLQKDYETAQLGYDWCLGKLYNAVEQNPTDTTKKLLAMAEDWYGRLFLECDRCEDGLKLMVDSLTKMRGVPDIEKEHIVIQLNDLGTVCDRLGRTEESISYFKEAIEISKDLDMEEIGAIYVNLGRAYLKTQLIDAARKSCGYAWKLGVMSKNKDVKKEAELCIKQINNIK